MTYEQQLKAAMDAVKQAQAALKARAAELAALIGRAA